MEATEQVHWDVRLDKERYGPGDTIRVIGSFRSTAEEPRSWTVHTLLRQIDAEEFPVGIVPYSIELEPGREREVVIREARVTDDFPPGDYSIGVGLEIERGVTDFKEVKFRIEGTSRPLDLRVILSRGRGERNLRVFTPRDKKVFVQVASDVRDLALSGTCTDPQGKQIPLEFENMVASFLPTGEGPYTLRISAGAKGYKPLTKELVFSVIRDRPTFGGLDSIRGKRKTQKD
jgi:hypothetical protein